MTEKYHDFKQPRPVYNPTTADFAEQKGTAAQVCIDMTTGKIIADGYRTTPTQETQQPDVKIDGGKEKA
jgi:hypothetical protein